MHIQKTAGSTFNRILRRQYWGYQAFYLNEVADMQRFSQLSPQDRQKPTLFLGHGFLKTGIQEVDEAPNITFLREPIARVRSLCQHYFEGKPSYLSDRFQSQAFNLDTFLDSGNIELANFQTRCLVQQPAQPFEALLNRLSSSDIVELALHNLCHHCLCFGLTEYFDESLMVFKDVLKWPIPPIYYPKNQRNPHRVLSLQAHHIKKIAELNQLDLELYRQAQMLFETAMNRQENAFKQLTKFRRMNQFYQQVVKPLPHPEGLPYPLQVVIKALK